MRPNQRVLPCGCEFGFRVALATVKDKSGQESIRYVTSRCNLRHTKHELSKETIKLYQVKRYKPCTVVMHFSNNIVNYFVVNRFADPNVINYAEKALAAGAKSNLLRQQMIDDQNLYLTAKFMQNLKQQIGNSMFISLLC